MDKTAPETIYKEWYAARETWCAALKRGYDAKVNEFSERGIMDAAREVWYGACETKDAAIAVITTKGDK